MILADALVFSWYAASFVAAWFWKPIFTVAISAGTVTFSEARISMFLLSLTTLENWAEAERGMLPRTSVNAKSLCIKSSSQQINSERPRDKNHSLALFQEYLSKQIENPSQIRPVQ